MPEGKELESWLIAIRDMLWITDFYGGHQWAEAHISPAVVEAMRKVT
jgi:hypothetical protein